MQCTASVQKIKRKTILNNRHSQLWRTFSSSSSFATVSMEKRANIMTIAAQHKQSVFVAERNKQKKKKKKTAKNA